MRTTGKGVYKWLKKQKNVVWPKNGGGLMVYFDYFGVRCCGIISKTYMGNKLVETNLKIRPVSIVYGNGHEFTWTVYKKFKEKANKK